MADEADLAFDSEQRHMAQALAAQRRRRSVMQPIGQCHYCGDTERIAQRLFCDSECAAAWEHESALRTRQGLPARQALH
ncbi:hypothetical protein WG922_01965 [Ramlibacter sp. AN1015]|uniref:hypothetical protein n=1 Tax=Ramlibacter sp. AN1015 TaxID=3133428 RepID=UPI0030C27DEE